MVVHVRYYMGRPSGRTFELVSRGHPDVGVEFRGWRSILMVPIQQKMNCGCDSSADFCILKRRCCRAFGRLNEERVELKNYSARENSSLWGKGDNGMRTRRVLWSMVIVTGESNDDNDDVRVVSFFSFFFLIYNSTRFVPILLTALYTICERIERKAWFWPDLRRPIQHDPRFDIVGSFRPTSVSREATKN